MAAAGPDKVKAYMDGYVNVFEINLPSRGRPRIFETPEQLKTVINEYFDLCISSKERPLISGLVLYLGFCDKQSMLDMERNTDLNPVFSFMIKRARTAIEFIYERGLWNPMTVTGSIFALKQFGWLDQQSIAITDNSGLRAPKLTPNESLQIAQDIKSLL